MSDSLIVWNVVGWVTSIPLTNQNIVWNVVGWVTSIPLTNQNICVS